VFVGGSEEVGGMQDVIAFTKNEQQPAVCIVPDSGYPVSVGEKGILHLKCRSRDTLKNVTAFEGGKAYNVVLDHVNVTVNGASEVYEGLAAHASTPHLGENAAYKAAAALCERADICETDRDILKGLRDTVCGFYGEEVDVFSEGAFGKLTCANGIVQIEDGHLLFTLDIRYGNEFDSKAGIQRLTAAMDARGYDTEVVSDNPGFLLDEGGDEMNCILGAYRDAADRPEAQPYKTYGGTYARCLKNAFAVSHSLPWDKTALNLPEGHGGAHQSDECTNVEAFLGGIAGLALAVARLDELSE
jgi:succinyl-diaminopimelate desuccinylase